MKKLKKGMLLLACGLVSTAIVVTSCKKESGGTPISTKPTISSVAPNSGPVGTAITITGTNLASATVSFNGTAATPTSTSATQIVVNVPAGATTGNITVTTSNGSATSAFTVTASTTPTISSVTPNTALVGTAVTITGTNLAGATVSFNGTAATPTSTSATQIVVNVPAGATTGNITVTTASGSATIAFTVDVPVLTSDEVAKANLVAHWRFDDTKKEDTSNTNPASSNGTTEYVTGKIGKALKFTAANMVYPTFDKFNNNPTLLADGFTISFWAQLPATSSFTSIIQLNGNIGDIFGLIQLAHRKNPDPAVPGSSGLDFDGALTHVNATGTHSTAFDAMLEGAGFLSTATEWIFVTMTYSDATRKITYYGNGSKIGEKDVAITVIPADQKFEMVTTASNPGVTTNQFSFGALNTNPPFAVGPAPAGWQGTSLTGVLDDVRVFNKALSVTEIGDLYTRGNAGH